MTSYRVSKKYAFKMTGLFALFTAGSIWAAFDMKSVEIPPSLAFILLGFMGLYVFKLSKDDTGGKGLQIALTIAGGVTSLALILILGGVGLAIIGVSLFGILGAYYVWINVIKAQPVIQANTEKLVLFNGFFKGRNWQIPWREVRSLAIREQNLYAGNKMQYLVVGLKDPESFNRQHQSKALKKVMAMNEKMYGGQLAVVASNLNVSEDDLISQLNRYL